jgi:hypothetical protein
VDSGSGLNCAIVFAIVSVAPLWLNLGKPKRHISMINDVSASDLRRAATIKDKIETLQAELNNILGGHVVGNGLIARTQKKSGRRKMSAAGRAKIAAAARARWAKVKAAGKKTL